MAWLIRGARLLDPARGVDRTGDVLIDGGRVAKVGGEIRVDGEPETIEAAGLVLSPSFVDMHVHLREPGREDAETIESGTRAAAAGGFGAVA
ncbi:MAG: dihydroorotase, partial [Candidatus Latescibacterota bacterium]